MSKSYLMQLYVGPCHLVSAEIAVAMAVPIENPTDCEVRGFICFVQADEILGYLVKEASSRVELFCCTTMHVRILPGRHKPCCVSNSIGVSSSILRTNRTWHRGTFPCFQKWRIHQRIRQSMRRRIDACLRVDGGHFEHLYLVIVKWVFPPTLNDRALENEQQKKMMCFRTYCIFI